MYELAELLLDPEITETLRIRETGAAEPLSDYPRKLFVKA